MKLKKSFLFFITEMASTWRAAHFLQETMQISWVKYFWWRVIFADCKSLYIRKKNKNVEMQSTFYIFDDD